MDTKPLRKPVYMDYQSTTPVDPRVLQVMLPYFTEHFGNPHSKSHAYGWEAEAAVDRARQQVADVIGANEKEIIFTSGATESNNLAIKGVAHFYQQKRNHIIAVATEHKCVIETCRRLEQEGFKVSFFPVQANGLLDLAQLEAAITDETLLISVMAVNNEIGVLQPLADIGAICRKHGVFFHTDAAQAFGKIPLDVESMQIDLMSISGHKIYGPKGVGALYVRRRPRLRLQPLFDGGGQERGLRSGTLPTPLVVGLGEAAMVAKQEMTQESQRLKKFREMFLTGIFSQLDDVYLNGDKEHSFPGCMNLSFGQTEGDSLLLSFKDLAVSSGSACSSASIEPSYVLQALGVDKELAHSSIRFGMGRFTTEEEVLLAIETVVANVKKLREKSLTGYRKQAK